MIKVELDEYSNDENQLSAESYLRQIDRILKSELELVKDSKGRALLAKPVFVLFNQHCSKPETNDAIIKLKS